MRSLGPLPLNSVLVAKPPVLSASTSLKSSEVSPKARAGLSMASADRFARTNYFMLFNTETKTYFAVLNDAVKSTGGAGAKAVKILSDHGVSVVLCPEVGPKAMEALNGFDIKPYNFIGETSVETAVQSFLNNQLQEIGGQ